MTINKRDELLHWRVKRSRPRGGYPSLNWRVTTPLCFNFDDEDTWWFDTFAEAQKFASRQALRHYLIKTATELLNDEEQFNGVLDMINGFNELLGDESIYRMFPFSGFLS